MLQKATFRRGPASATLDDGERPPEAHAMQLGVTGALLALSYGGKRTR